MAVAALFVSLLAVVLSGIAVAYARQQATAALEANWLSHTFSIDADLSKRQGPTSSLVVIYKEGPPLDDLICHVIESDKSPVLGFGTNSVEGPTRHLGPVRVNERKEASVMRRSSGRGISWVGGDVLLRFECRSGRHRSEVPVTVHVQHPPATS